MGAPMNDYKQIAPPNSYIHVDDFVKPKHLANYLLYLANNRTAYNAYFQWKREYKVVTESTFFCDLCTKLNNIDLQSKQIIDNIDLWWRPKGICANVSE
jgi:hypothetical protein